MLADKLKNLYRVAEVELTYKNTTEPQDRIRVSSSIEAYHVFKGLWDFDKIDLVEQFKILMLNRNNACLGVSNLTSGGTASCPVDPKLVFATALKANAAAIIMVHNHPSGNPQPSETDIILTKKMCGAGNVVGITVLDHVIITRHNYLSMGDEGLMPLASYTL
ncbi:JAB domain-containing protein [Mucilaginibacter phyllosphaerae]|uniref:DNA repair protein n=1 Tax=Mucilaginibacter phyllosphaerae TaxID=1812349 RepID=A0A4Y8AD87_9SPHI|nr:JAB domain-containing protein [Mucilaginibacter phyllosphaerae]MBB3969306.1 DNA repair protein RadC [Mucilaginibacter phyllosphaerae]TEW65898.1 DNA repair protein [Mucilaginibacter phyllosphaerae]GGH07560.1 DNA repair protein [Mucilaginibacter phyllosphaerae]